MTSSQSLFGFLGGFVFSRRSGGGFVFGRSGGGGGKLLLEEIEDGRGVGAQKLFYFVTVLEEHEGRHRTNTKVLGEVREVVNVELREVNLVFELG